LVERGLEVSGDGYLGMSGKTTAALLAASGQAGAMVATGDPEVGEMYRRFGYDLGIAFQIADDLKGTFWASAASGKREAGDVRKRKKTFPLVWALEHAPDDDRARLGAIYQPVILATDGSRPPDADTGMSIDEVDEVLAILERSGARAAAEA